MVKIVIATPAYGEIFCAPYVQSILRLQRLCDRNQWQSIFATISYADVSESRNYLLTHWFDKTDASHIVFIDADMGFDPRLIFDMIGLGKPVVGVVSPKRQVDVNRVYAAGKRGLPLDRAIATGHDFIYRPLKAKRAPGKRDGFIEVAACGAGIMVIQRSCIQTMLRRIPELSDVEAKKNSPLAKNLDRLIRAFDIARVDGTRLSEDYAFCHRWHTMCEGEIWANISYEITHVGVRHFKARYADAMPAGPRITVKQGKAELGITKVAPRGQGSAKAGSDTIGSPKMLAGRIAVPARNKTGQA